MLRHSEGASRWTSRAMASSLSALLYPDSHLAEWLRRTFDFDVFAGVRCGGRLKGLGVREGGPREERELREAGGTRLMPKPVDFERLCAELEAAARSA